MNIITILTVKSSMNNCNNQGIEPRTLVYETNGLPNWPSGNNPLGD